MIRATLFIAAMLATGSALADESAAVLASQSGTVLVNQGEQFVTAAEAQPLNVGDRVMVMEGGSASIAFADGCELALDSGSLVVVEAASPCAGMMASIERIGPSFAQAVGAPGEGDADNRGAGWIFGGWTALIAYALIENNYSIEPDPSASP